MNNESTISVSTDSKDRLVEIGVVGRAHGIAGALNVFLHNPDSTILNKLDCVYLQDNDGLKRVAIKEFRAAAKKRTIVFEGIESRTDAEKINGAKLLVSRSLLPKLKNDEFYITDLIGAEVWDGETQLGTVTAGRPQGDVEIITITSDTHTMEVPLVDDFVEIVDCAAGKVVLKDTHLLPAYPRKKAPRKQ